MRHCNSQERGQRAWLKGKEERGDGDRENEKKQERQEVSSRCEKGVTYPHDDGMPMDHHRSQHHRHAENNPIAKQHTNLLSRASMSSTASHATRASGEVAPYFREASNAAWMASVASGRVSAPAEAHNRCLEPLVLVTAAGGRAIPKAAAVRNPNAAPSSDRVRRNMIFIVVRRFGFVEC